MPDEAPPGNFRRIRFPEAALLDQGTREGWISRKLSSDGGRALDLPRTISMQYIDDQGHLRSVPVGSIHEETFDGETGKLSFQGWLADTDDGHLAERVVFSKALRHNSIDIGDVPPDGVKITEHGNFWDDDFWMEVEFTDWAVAKTTLVATPAFKNAHAEVDAEIEAALGVDGELVVDCPGVFTSGSPVEIMAAMSTRPSWDYFNRPEADIPHPIVVDEPDAAGWIPVYGNLAQWRKLHRDSRGVLRHPPRGYDGYANFAKPKAVLTDNGWVAAGPITLLGGHVSLADAANKVENVWADVRVIDGKHGPWVCGVVRPGIAADDVAVYRARASQISGYWQGDVLRLICSVTAAGYPVTESEEQDALVAAFDPEPPTRGPFPIDALVSFDEITPEAQARVRAWVESGTGPLVMRGPANVLAEIQEAGVTPGQIMQSLVDDLTVDPDDEFDVQAAAWERERELALEDEAAGLP
jgi:hypothetical protein